MREVRANEESLAYAAHLLEINSKTVREENPTAYLLRRHFATTMASVCVMDEEELQYLMGHDIRNKDIRHTDLLDVDWLFTMYRELNLRHIFTDPAAAAFIGASGGLENIDDCELDYREARFQNGGRVVLDVWSCYPADALTLRAWPTDPSAGSMAALAADYRPVTDPEPPSIRFDSAYHRALDKALQRSETRSKSRDEAQ